MSHFTFWFKFSVERTTNHCEPAGSWAEEEEIDAKINLKKNPTTLRLTFDNVFI